MNMETTQYKKYKKSYPCVLTWTSSVAFIFSYLQKPLNILTQEDEKQK